MPYKSLPLGAFWTIFGRNFPTGVLQLLYPYQPANPSVESIFKALKFFKKFTINKKLMSLTKKDCIFLHCLPRGSEVDENVFFSRQSRVWEQAANRVHVQKSIIKWCLD